MELLAPAGSKEAFIAALQAGADAVYLGAGPYHARVHADALSLYDLEVMAGYAHGRGAKIYVAFNTLIKQNEFADAVRKIARIAQIGPDGIIVQDAGIARVVARHFPDLPLHASTQLAVHNRAGLDVCRSLGFSRAVLARELSFNELKILSRKPPVELEVFCHGALCFSISGMCLLSSFIGGQSGNRGRCTQPCRRRWRRDGATGYVYSPKDLSLAAHVPALKRAGIHALKIEGRMRSSEYVSRVVAAYRLLIDAPPADEAAALAAAETLLADDYAREKTTFLFAGSGEALFAPAEPQCLGKRIGTVRSCDGTAVIVDTAAPLQEGDRFRIADPRADRTVSGTARLAAAADGCVLAAAARFPAGAVVYKAGDAAWDEKGLVRAVDAMYRAHATPVSAADPVAVDRIVSSACGERFPAVPVALPELWVTMDDPGWWEHIPDDTQIGVVLALSRETAGRLTGLLPQRRGNRLAAELPPYIGQREAAAYRHDIEQLAAAGVNHWVVNNISHFAFVPAAAELIAGPFLYTWNLPAALLYAAWRVTGFIASWEDDRENIETLAARGLASRLIVNLFGYPPLVRTKMIPRPACSALPVDGNGIRLREYFSAGTCTVIPADPVALFAHRRTLAQHGIRQFGIDLRGLSVSRAAWQELYAAYLHGHMPAFCSSPQAFNSERGVR